jgi:hypothetical protein
MLLLLAWTVWGSGVELAAAARVLAVDRAPRAVAFWRLGTDKPEALRALAAEVDRRAAAGDVVAVAHAAADTDQAFFLSLWTAYYLPRQRVIRLAHPRARAEAAWLLTWGTRFDHPRLVREVDRPEGTVSRVLPP